MARPASASAMTQAERARAYRLRKSGECQENPVSLTIVTETPRTVTETPVTITPSLSASPRLAAVSREGVSVTRPGGTCQLHVPNTPKLSFTESIPDVFDGLADPFRDVFCDWITVYQDFPNGGLPVLNGGYVVGFEPEAIVEALRVNQDTGEFDRALTFDATKATYTTHKKIKHEGSYETAVQVRCDGSRVEFSGNASRFGRPDNLFGLPVLECVERASDIIEAMGLPRFSDVDKTTGLAHSDSFTRHNAVITRVDLTSNFATGGKAEAHLILDSYLGQGTKRGANPPKYYKNGISWNEGSKRHYEKLYYKGAELGGHASEEVRNYCESHGVLRFEVSIKARELADKNLQRMMNWARVIGGNRMENVIFGKFAEVLHRQDGHECLDLDDIPGKVRLIAQAYLDGRDPYHSMSHSERTRQRWRKALLDHGLDIAIPRNVVQMERRVRVLDLMPLTRPAWYQVAA